MAERIVMRLPADLVDFVDEQVRSGVSRDRSHAVACALVRERRRARAADDLAILLAERSFEDPDGLDDLAEFARRLPVD